MYSIDTYGNVKRYLDNAVIPEDATNRDRQEYENWLGAGNTPDATAHSFIQVQYEAALDAHLDAVARSHRYDNRFTFAMRAGYPGPYRDEAIAFGTWMDTCNAQAFALLQDVLDGSVSLPSIDDFIAALPNHD